MKFGFLRNIFAAACLAASLVVPSQAAFINIDDSDLTMITITAGDFERGFSVNGVLLTTGLGASGSITLPDSAPGPLISGSWIDLGVTTAGSRVDIHFALPSDLAFSTSGVEFDGSTDGFFATLTGSFGGFIDSSQYFPINLPTTLQDGHTEFGSLPFLTVSFKSEAAPTAVPTPGTLSLVGLLLAGLPLVRRRFS